MGAAVSLEKSIMQRAKESLTEKGLTHLQADKVTILHYHVGCMQSLYRRLCHELLRCYSLPLQPGQFYRANYCSAVDKLLVHPCEQIFDQFR